MTCDSLERKKYKRPYLYGLYAQGARKAGMEELERILNTPYDL